MERKDFLKGISVVGLGSLIPAKKALSAFAGEETLYEVAACTLIPSETRGPYLLDYNTTLLRNDIRESKTGVLTTVTITLQNTDCMPVPGARVDIWHCDKDGYYSGYVNSGYLGNQNNVGQTFCHGAQITNALGQVTFTTVFPGWYIGRQIIRFVKQ